MTLSLIYDQSHLHSLAQDSEYVSVPCSKYSTFISYKYFFCFLFFAHSVITFVTVELFSLQFKHCLCVLRWQQDTQIYCYHLKLKTKFTVPFSSNNPNPLPDFLSLKRSYFDEKFKHDLQTLKQADCPFLLVVLSLLSVYIVFYYYWWLLAILWLIVILR